MIHYAKALAISEVWINIDCLLEAEIQRSDVRNRCCLRQDEFITLHLLFRIFCHSALAVPLNINISNKEIRFEYFEMIISVGA